jgi:hypothetical protein
VGWRSGELGTDNVDYLDDDDTDSDSDIRGADAGGKNELSTNS